MRAHCSGERRVKPAILLVDHGSRRPEANAQLEALGEQVQARVGERFVTIAHMELAEPSIADGIAACVDAGATEIVVHPFFLGPGNHTAQDIPRLVAEAAAQHPGVRAFVGPPLGLDDKLVDLVLERIDQAG